MPDDEHAERAQIEVTEAMVEAGARMFAASHALPLEKVVAAIYREMVIQSRFGDE